MSTTKDFWASQTVDNSINQLLSVVMSETERITGVRGPQKDQAKTFESLLNDLNAVRGRPVFYPYVGTGLGRGPYVELEDGSVKLDFINGIGVHILGHSHPTFLKAAVKGSLSDVIMQGHLQMNSEYLEISQKVLKLAKGSRLKHAWICPSGSMANENALKMARQKNTPARKVMAMVDAFAGRTTMMAEITDNPKYKVGLPSYNEVLRVPYYDKNDPKSSEKALSVMKEHIANNKGDISAFCFEPMLGEGGYKVAPREFFIPLLEECKKNGIAVWADEVQTFLRTGEAFAFQTIGFGEYIDLCTIAKTAQCGITLFTEEYNPQPGLIAGTFASSTGALSAGMAIIDELANNNYFGKDGKIAKIHKRFVEMLQELCEGSCKGYLVDPEGMGLMVAVTPFSGDVEKTMKLLKLMFEKGFIAFGCGKNPFRLRFLVPAIVEEKDLSVACKIIEESILELKDK